MEDPIKLELPEEMLPPLEKPIDPPFAAFHDMSSFKQSILGGSETSC